MTVKDNPSRIERRKERIREQIINAALQAFAECGYVKTTVNDITTRADVGHGTFYQYFKNKQDLLVMLADDLAEKLYDYVRPKNKHLSTYERMYYEARGILNFYVKHKSLLAALKEAMMLERQFEEKWMKINESLFKRIERDIKGSMEKGYCRDIDVGVTIRALTCMLEGYAHYVMMEPPGSVDIDAAADSLTDLAYHAVFKLQT